MIWESEPNYMKFNYNGFLCEVVRNKFGALNGYVYIPANNIYHGVDELHLNSLLRPSREITYSNESGSFWKIGFDCSHINDYSPSVELSPISEFMKELEVFCDYKPATQEDYKDIVYVIKQIKNLVLKLVSIKDSYE